MKKIWEEIVSLDYILSQGYSKNVDEDVKRLNELRFLYERYEKIKKINDNINNK